MDETSNNLELPYLRAAQAQKHVTHNEALERLDLLVHLTVQSYSETTPPIAPIEGQVWAVGVGAVNDWAGHDGELAAWSNGGWLYLSPREGWRAAMGTVIRVWNGTQWAPSDLPPLQNLPGVGIGTSYDGTNRLAVASDASLFSHDGNGHQMILNKATTGDTGSLLYQSNWSGRAEMGLAGSDDFAIKVSPDGATWQTALSIDAASGRSQFAQPAELATGNAAAPGLAFVGDTDTGLFRPTADEMAVAVGGLEKMRFTSAGAELTGELGGSAVQSTALDTGIGRLLKVSAFGLGATDQSSVTLNDAETNLASGFYSGGGSGANAATFPNALARNQPVLNLTRRVANGDYGQMRLFFSETSAWFRSRSALGSSWGDFVKIFTNHNILGAVSKSGGVPTGALIESGSNANGDYIRFANGMQICWKTHVVGASVNVAGTTGIASGWGRSDPIEVPFAAAFLSAPTQSLQFRRKSSSERLDVQLVRRSNASNLRWDFHILAPEPLTLANGYFAELVAVGAWA